MDNICNNPGLVEISQTIFSNLATKDLFKCSEVNTYWEYLLNQPLTWLRVCSSNGLPQQNKLKWQKLIKSTNEPRILKQITKYLTWIRHLLTDPEVEIKKTSPFWIAFMLNDEDFMKFILQNDSNASQKNCSPKSMPRNNFIDLALMDAMDNYEIYKYGYGNLDN